MRISRRESVPGRKKSKYDGSAAGVSMTHPSKSQNVHVADGE